MSKDETKRYRRILRKNKAYNKAFEECIEELRRVPLFSNEKEKLMEHYACTWAPVFTEFTTWVLNDAKKRGIKKIYFLSRDAYPMYRIARALCSNDENSETDSNAGMKPVEKVSDNTVEPHVPELHYLRVSRYSLRVPEMLMRKGKFLDKVFLSGIDVTMRKILQRAALTEEEIKEVADIIRFDKSLDAILSRPEILRWKRRAEERKWEIWPYVQGHSRKLLPTLLGYLRSEGMMNGEKIAIVDSGWVGSTQKSLLNILKYDKPGVDMEGYYFGLYELPKKVDKSKYHSFYFAPWRDVKRKVNFSNCLFEAVSSENKGMTLRYEKNIELFDETLYEPILADGGSLNKDFLKDAETVLDIYANAYKKNQKYDSKRRISPSILKQLMAKPDEWEASTYGNLLFCDDVLENGAQAIAAKLSYEDICNLRLFRKTKIWLDSRMGKPAPTIHESGWIYGSIVNCGGNVTFSLWEAKLYNWLMYVRKSLIRRS